MEGPSLFIVQQELHFLVNKKVLEASGNASFDKKVLCNRKIYDIYSYGKRLVIQFKNHAVITHFLMFGSYRINEQREDKVPRLALITTGGSLYLYNCSVKCFDESNFKATLDFGFDIVSPAWDIKKVIRAVKRNPEKTIDDILLDQTIFTGVGNIIKNEVLFLSKVSPFAKVSQLSGAQLKTIALNAREFSLNFIGWRRNFELKKHLLIYNKRFCPVSGTKVIRQKTGTKNRISYFCPVCQKL